MDNTMYDSPIGPTPSGAPLPSNTIKPSLGSVGSSTTYYTVKSGDTLSGIAKKYGTSYPEIMQLNGLTKTTIYPGQVLAIPKSGAPYDSYIQYSAPIGPTPSGAPLPSQSIEPMAVLRDAPYYTQTPYAVAGAMTPAYSGGIYSQPSVMDRVNASMASVAPTLAKYGPIALAAVVVWKFVLNRPKKAKTKGGKK